MKVTWLDFPKQGAPFSNWLAISDKSIYRHEWSSSVRLFPTRPPWDWHITESNRRPESRPQICSLFLSFSQVKRLINWAGALWNGKAASGNLRAGAFPQQEAEVTGKLFPWARCTHSLTVWCFGETWRESVTHLRQCKQTILSSPSKKRKFEERVGSVGILSSTPLLILLSHFPVFQPHMLWQDVNITLALIFV